MAQAGHECGHRVTVPECDPCATAFCANVTPHVDAALTITISVEFQP